MPPVEQEFAAWGTPIEQPQPEPDSGELAAYLIPATEGDVALFSSLVHDDIVYCDFNHVLTQLTLDESMNLLRNYRYLVDWIVEVPTEHQFRFDGILAYHMYQDGTKLTFSTATSGAWPPSGSPWTAENPAANNYAAFGDFFMNPGEPPQINKADPRRVEGYNLTRLPHRIRQELESAFGTTWASRVTWFRMAGCNDARIAWLTYPLPRTAVGTTVTRRCFTARDLVNSSHDDRLVVASPLQYSDTGTALGRTGSTKAGEPSDPGPVGTPGTLAHAINQQPADFRIVNDGIYGPRWHETSVTVNITGGGGNPWEPAFFDADFSIATSVEVLQVLSNTAYTLTVNTGTVTHNSGSAPTVSSIILGLKMEWDMSGDGEIQRFVASVHDSATKLRLLPASVPLKQNRMRYPVTSTGGPGPLAVNFPTLTPTLVPDERITTWNYDSTDEGNAQSFVPSNAYAAPKYRSPYFRFVITGYGTDSTKPYELAMQQRAHDYWTNDDDTGYLDVTSPAPLPVPQWYINGHEEEMTFSDLARVMSGKNAFFGSFDTMQTDSRFESEVGRYIPMDLGFEDQFGDWSIWEPGSKASGFNSTDCRESLWNSFAFRKTGEIIGLAFQAIAAAFAEAGGYPLNGFHYRHQYKAPWTYDSGPGYDINGSPWDWGDCHATHQAPGIYGELLQQWRWRLSNMAGQSIRPGPLLPLSLLSGANLITATPDPDPNEPQEAGYTAFAQHYGSVVSAAAASRKPIVAYIDQSTFDSQGKPIPQVGSVHGTYYWNELILHSAMQGEAPNPCYWYNPPGGVDDISRAFSELTLYNLLTELDDVLGNGSLIPHIPRPFRYQDPYVLTRVDARGKFISRLTPHALAFPQEVPPEPPPPPYIIFDQQTDSLTVTITYQGSVFPPVTLFFPTGRHLVGGVDFPQEYAPKGFWIEQTRLYRIPGPDAWEFQQPYIRRRRVR